MDTYSFGRYKLHRQPLRLQDGSRTVRLTARQLNVLLLLARARGEVVLREDFLKQVWGDAFVEESNLTQTIFLLRRTLGKSASGGDLIETIPKVGYRIDPSSIELSSVDPGALACFALAPGMESAQDLHHLNTLVDSIADFAFYILDPSGRVRTWNCGAERAKGYGKDEVLGKHYSTFFIAEDVAEGLPERLLSRAVRSGRVSGEGWRQRKNGERFWVSYVLTAIKNASGRLIGFGKAVHDITQHKLREDALQKLETVARQERDCFLAVAESSMDAIFICSAIRDDAGEIIDFTFTFLNSNVEKMVSIPRSILLGGSMCELLPANRVLGLFEEYRQVVLTGKPFVTSFPIRVATVASEWIRLRAVRLGNGIAITASDISELKRAEERAFQSSRTDTLTQLKNRVAALECLAQINQQHPERGSVLALHHVTIVGFAELNTSLGECGGDCMLKAVAHRLSNFANIDSAFRIGGARFLVVSQVRDEASAVAMGESLERCLRHPFSVEKLRINPSFRVALHLCQDEKAEPEDLLHAAEAAVREQGSGSHLVPPEKVPRLQLAGQMKIARQLLHLIIAFLPALAAASTDFAGT